MPRVKGGSVSDKKRKKLFAITKGYFGLKKHTYRMARQQYLKSLSRAYNDRKRKKRDFVVCGLPNHAAARMNGMSYSFS